jgi:hypothetical protein
MSAAFNSVVPTAGDALEERRQSARRAASGSRAAFGTTLRSFRLSGIVAKHLSCVLCGVLNRVEDENSGLAAQERKNSRS